MHIGTRKIGPSEPPLVIAEIGINYDSGENFTFHLLSLNSFALIIQWD
mgnify:CR=1 FL=1